MILAIVDFPDPDAPAIPSDDDVAISSEILSTAANC